MEETGFYICEEDNVFDTLSSLYEEVQPCPYAGAPGLDPELEWAEEDYYNDLLSEDDLIVVEEDYDTDTINIQRGDIVLAEVYQEGSNVNLAHKLRPFLITYANMNYAYGFQITHSKPASLTNYRIEIPEYASCGLMQPCAFMVNMVRGVAIHRIKRYIGHITKEQKQVLLDKLYDIKINKDGLYTDCPFNDRIDITIENIERIPC